MSKIRKPKLLLCPFCGDKEYPPALNYDDHWNYFSVLCQSCGAEGYNAYAHDHDNPKREAIKMWNKRVTL